MSPLLFDDVFLPPHNLVSPHRSLKFKHGPSADYPYSVILLNKKRYENGALIKVTPANSVAVELGSNLELVLRPTDAVQLGQVIHVFIRFPPSSPSKS